MFQLQPGSTAPSLEGIEFVRGQRLTRIRPGTAHVIDFWATWCLPCRESLPHLSQLQKRYPGAAFLAISTERDGAVVRRYVQQHQKVMTFAVGYDPSGIAAGNWLRAAGRNTIPSTFVINTKGQIAWLGHPLSLDRDVSLKELLGLSPQGLSAQQQSVVTLTNQQRSREGLPELRVSSALMKAAQDYATLMASLGHFSHTSPDGSGPKERAKQAGYESGYCGENIAMGQQTASDALGSWMKSQGHRENILRPQYQEIGVGHATGKRGHYWVQLFGARR